MGPSLSPNQKIKGFKLVHLNTRSYPPKKEQIQQAFNHYDFISITESWLNKQHDDSQIHWPQKQYFRVDRQTKQEE